MLFPIFFLKSIGRKMTTNPNATDVFSRILQNWTIVFTGGIFAAGFNILSLTITARYLGLEEFGLLVLAQTYAKTVDGLVNFQTWQAVISYSGKLISDQKKGVLVQLFKLGFLADLCTAFLGFLVAFAFIYCFELLGYITAENTKYYYFYSLFIAFNFSGTATAIVRLFNKFVYAALSSNVSAITKLVCVVLAFYLEASFDIFFAIWVIADVLLPMILIAFSLKVLRTENIQKYFLAGGFLSGRYRFPGFVKFLVTTNLSSSTRLTTQEMDTLVIGWGVGEAAVALYQIAKRYSMVVIRFGDPLQQVAYPELAKLWAQDKLRAFKKAIWKSGAFAGAVGTSIFLVALGVGDAIYPSIVGTQFAESFEPLLVLLLANAVFMFGISFRPAMLSMSEQNFILKIYIVGAALFYTILILTLDHLDILAGAISHLGFNLFWFIMMITRLRANLSKAKPSSAGVEHKL